MPSRCRVDHPRRDAGRQHKLGGLTVVNYAFVNELRHTGDSAAVALSYVLWPETSSAARSTVAAETLACSAIAARGGLG